jgi:RNA polymerase sigma-70 factor (ECF subfamily)
MPEIPRPSGQDAAASSSAAETSDGSLLRRFQRGQLDAATQLYLRYADRLHALATARFAADLKTRFDPEDIVQSVFRTFFRRAAQGHYDVPHGEELWKLLLVIALNKIRALGSFHRKAKRDVRMTSSGTSFEKALESKAGRDEVSLATLRIVIDEVLNTLPASQRQIIELRFEGYQVEEIARKSERSKRSVERALQDFRNKLGSLIYEDV